EKLHHNVKQLNKLTSYTILGLSWGSYPYVRHLHQFAGELPRVFPVQASFAQVHDRALLSGHDQNDYQDSDITELITELEQNNTDLAEFISVVDNQKYVNLVEAYHNASIYNAIRGVWSSQLNPLLPAIDQLAILEYFAERRSNEHFRMSFWARLWAAIRAWLSGKQEFIECNADEPRCMRRIVEKLPLEARVELDRAAETEDLATVENIITEELTNQPKSARVEYELWKNANQPPQPLLDIIADKTDVEE
ncbi:hypothetical protein ANCDUO_16415, partial [Ancylostoma duodenale]